LAAAAKDEKSWKNKKHLLTKAAALSCGRGQSLIDLLLFVRRIETICFHPSFSLNTKMNILC
jgi:hypothetical protein